MIFLFILCKSSVLVLRQLQVTPGTDVTQDNYFNSVKVFFAHCTLLEESPVMIPCSGNRQCPSLCVNFSVAFLLTYTYLFDQTFGGHQSRQIFQRDHEPAALKPLLHYSCTILCLPLRPSVGHTCVLVLQPLKL